MYVFKWLCICPIQFVGNSEIWRTSIGPMIASFQFQRRRVMLELPGIPDIYTCGSYNLEPLWDKRGNLENPSNVHVFVLYKYIYIYICLRIWIQNTVYFLFLTFHFPIETFFFISRKRSPKKSENKKVYSITSLFKRCKSFCENNM